MKTRPQARNILVKIPNFYIDPSYLEGNPKDIITYLQDLPEKVRENNSNYSKQKYPDADSFETLDIELLFDDSYGSEIILRAFRQETDLELNDRLAQEEQTKMIRAENLRNKKEEEERKEKELYESLKAKYEQ